MTSRNSSFAAEIHDLATFDGPFDAYPLPAEGRGVLFATYLTGTVIEAHHHDTNNVGVITKFQLRLTIDGTETRYGPGDRYRVAAGVRHAARFDTDSAEIESWFSSRPSPAPTAASPTAGIPDNDRHDQ